MSTKNPSRAAGEESFSFGVGELRAAQRAAAPPHAGSRETSKGAAAARKRVSLALIDSLELQHLHLAEDENKGFDPYNSGSFDRRNAWSKIGKR
jgi:hypothetical protein